ncbi:MAG: 3-hydroxyacyl-CoA dehydrogenase family protein [Firmicutes bacterium]|nr:3-hydroxyacyl-CoA dehydrogenase family protein [Bacillota bacterium]
MYIKKVAVVGAGTMGADICYTIAMAGIPVVIRDVSNEQLDHARQHIQELFQGRVARNKMSPADVEDRMNFITFSGDLDDLDGVTLAIEAVTEKMAVKEAVFRELDQVLSPLSVIVSNTSALSISHLATVTSRPTRVAGMHFFYPAHMMKLVEVIAGDQTSSETVEAVMRLAEEIRKIPVKVKECPGFVVNRILMSSMAEVLRYKEEHQLEAASIDQVITQNKLAPMGPFMLADALGLDVALEVANTLYQSLGDRFKPSRELEQLVAEGHLGMKTGQGFYSYR